jgi:hypothetical protein
MDTLKLPEQEIINALCVYISRQENTAPEEVMVELIYEDDIGFGAEADYRHQHQFVKESGIIQSLRKWVQSQYDLDPFSVGIQLELIDHEGIVAFVK